MNSIHKTSNVIVFKTLLENNLINHLEITHNINKNLPKNDIFKTECSE